MKVYTKSGDLGYTKDLSGRKLPKNDLKIVCWGKVDELQAVVDLALLHSKGKTKGHLQWIQRKLWQASAEMAQCTSECLNDPIIEKDLLYLEKITDALGEPPKKFVHMNTFEAIIFNECRVRCRSLERDLVGLLLKKKVRPVIFKYINRLSSFFFMLAYTKSKK